MNPPPLGKTAALEQAMRTMVAEIGPGAKLPSERVIADQLGVARTTVRLVLGRLVTEGTIDAEHGRGYYVR